jgi:hypothetical protein
LIEAQEVEVVPGFYNLPVAHADDAHTCKVKGVAGGGYAEPTARMFCPDSAAGCGLVALGDAIFDNDLYIREGIAESDA